MNINCPEPTFSFPSWSIFSSFSICATYYTLSAKSVTVHEWDQGDNNINNDYFDKVRKVIDMKRMCDSVGGALRAVILEKNPLLW